MESIEEKKRKLKNFSDALKPLIKNIEDISLQKYPSLGRPRPFVCDGNPLDCKVFIVGFNPATPMTTDFWKFWTASRGFEEKKWLKAYYDVRCHSIRAEKEKKGEEASDADCREPSRTRRALDCINAAAKHVKVLETNIYATPTKRKSKLPMSLRKTEIFEFLLTQIKPNLVIAHGRDAFKNCVDIEAKNSLSFEIWPITHLSQRWYDESARYIGQRIQTEFQNLT